MAALGKDDRKRMVLQTMQGIVNEIESKRLLLEAILENRPELADEVYGKMHTLQSNLDSIFLMIEYVEAECPCTQGSA